MSTTSKAMRLKKRAALRAAKVREMGDAAPAPAAGAGKGATSVPAAVSVTSPEDSKMKEEIEELLLSAVEMMEDNVQEKMDNRKLKYIYEMCQARLFIKQNLVLHFVNAPIKELQVFYIKQYGVVLKDDNEANFRKKVLGVLEDDIAIYKNIIEIFKANEENLVLIIAVFLKNIAFALPQHANHTKKPLSKIGMGVPDREKVIVRKLYNDACSLLDKYDRMVMKLLFNVNSVNHTFLKLDTTDLQDSLVKILLKTFKNLDDIVNFKLMDSDMPLVEVRATGFIVECGLQFRQREDVTQKLVERTVKRCLAINPPLNKITREEIERHVQAIYCFQHRGLDISILHEFHQLCDNIISIKSNQTLVANSDFIKYITQKSISVKNVVIYARKAIIKLMRLNRQLEIFKERLVKCAKQNEEFIAKKAKIDNLCKRLAILADKNDQNLEDTDLTYMRECKEASDKFISSLIERRKIFILHLAQDKPKMVVQDNTTKEEAQAMRLQATHDQVEASLQDFERITNAVIQYHEELYQFFSGVILKIHKKENTSAPGRTLQAQATTEADSNAAKAEKNVRATKNSEASNKGDSKDPEKWKQDVESKRQKLENERRKRHQEAAAEAIAEARAKQAARKLAFELSEEELKAREDNIRGMLRVTKPIHDLLTKLYANPHSFCCLDLMTLVNSLKQKGFLIDLESPRGGGSHFSVYLCMEEYQEKAGAFFMENTKAIYPNYIIHGLRHMFTRAGFSPSILNLVEQPVAANMLLAYPLALQQGQPQAGAAAAAAAAAAVAVEADPAVASQPTPGRIKN